MGLCASTLYSPENVEFFAAFEDVKNNGGPNDNDKSVKRAKQVIQRYPSVLIANRSLAEASSSWHAATMIGSVELLQFMFDFMLLDPSSPIPAHLPETYRKDQLREQMDSFNVKGHTPLMIAATRGHVDCVKFLLARGAYVLKIDGGKQGKGLTALHFAARAGKAESIRAILENLPSTMSVQDQETVKDFQSSSGLTALHFAVGFDHVACIETLLSFNVSLTARTRMPTQELGCFTLKGSTALHVAAQLLNLPAAISLLTHHAIEVVHSPSIPDPRTKLNSSQLAPFRTALIAIEMSNTLLGARGDIILLLEILRPSANLISMLEVKLPVRGPPKLAAIASSALRKKLLEDLEVAALATKFKRDSTCYEEDEDSLGGLLDDEGETDEEDEAPPDQELKVEPRGGSNLLTSNPGRQSQEEHREVFGDHVEESAASPLGATWTEIENAVSEGQAISLPPPSPFSSPTTPESHTSHILAASVNQPNSLSRFGKAHHNAVHPQPRPGSSSHTAPGSRLGGIMNSSAAGRRTSSVAFDGLSSIGNLKTKPGRNSTPYRGVKRVSNSRQKKVVDEDEDECFICLAAAPEVGVAGCDHKLCKSCANQMVLRLHKAPLTCPFCRQDVSGFVSIS